jgi:hypothetical protein
LLVAAQALREGMTVAEIHAIAKFDPWFLERLEEIVAAENQVASNGLPQDAEGLRQLKAMGFSDKRLAYLALQSAHLQSGMSRAIAQGSGIIHDAVKAMTGGEMPARTPWQLQDCGWVANRWCEMLPLPTAVKQRLMELDNPLLRLELVSDLLARNGITQG